MPFFLLIIIAISSWCLSLQYRGTTDFTDTLFYLANAKSLINDQQFTPKRIYWGDFVSGNGNLNNSLDYPGQLFSLCIGMVSKFLQHPVELWMPLALNFFAYTFSCVFCILFLLRFLRGWEFFVIGFFSLTNYYVMTACVSTLTDAWGYALFTLALWLSSFRKKPYFFIGVVLGISFLIRAHLVIFALFFPLLLCERFDKYAIRYTLLFILGIGCAYGGVLACLKFYMVPPSPPQTVLQYAQSHDIPFAVPETKAETQRNEVANADVGKSLFQKILGYYHGQIVHSFTSFKEHGVGWMTLGAYQTMGPASWFFGPLFFILVLSLFFKWSNPLIVRYTFYVICSFITFYGAAYMLLRAGPAEEMVAELKTLVRYFCYFFSLIPLLFWLVVRESLQSNIKMFPVFEKGKEKIFGSTFDTRLLMTGLLFCCIFPSSIGIWGYGAALLARMPVRQGVVVHEGDSILRKELQDFPPDSMVMSSRYPAVHLFSSIKHVVQCPASFDQFIQNKNNHLLDALVMFPKDVHGTQTMTEAEKEQWAVELNKESIIDVQGNKFVKVSSHQAEGPTDDVVNRRSFVIFRRVNSQKD